MDISSTRATRLNSIVRRLRSLGPLSTIDSVSQACANTSAHHLQRARRAEYLAAQYFLEQGFTLLYQNKKITGVEIDLIFLDQKCNVIFVEVKTLSQRGIQLGRLTKSQSERLFTAKLFFESVYGLPVEVRLAFVEIINEDVEDLVIL